MVPHPRRASKPFRTRRPSAARMLPTPATPIRFRRLLLTGAAGNLGRELRPRLKSYCETLRLSHRSEFGPAAAGEEIVMTRDAVLDAVHAAIPVGEPPRAAAIPDRGLDRVIVDAVPCCQRVDPAVADADESLHGARQPQVSLAVL